MISYLVMKYPTHLVSALFDSITSMSCPIFVIPYSGYFSRGINFRGFRGQLASAKI